jgi:hypothetical protein
LLGFFLNRAYINSCLDTAAHTLKLIYVLPLAACAAAVVYSTQSVGVYWQMGDRSMKPLAFAILYGEKKLGFWEALCATTHDLHHGSSSTICCG